MEPEIKGYVFKETMAGLFRAWVLNEMNLGVTCAVNEMLVAAPEQIIKKAGLDKDNCLSLIEECVVMGLLCENRVVFRDEEDIFLYMVDTGGIFAFEEAGIPYNKLSFTTGIDQRLKIYRKNIYLVENNLSEKEAVNLCFFEDVLGMQQNEKYRNATILVDMEIAEKLSVTEQVNNELDKMKKIFNATIFDIGNKKYIDK